MIYLMIFFFFFFQAEDGIRDLYVTGVQTCALPISAAATAKASTIRRFRRTRSRRSRPFTVLTWRGLTSKQSPLERQAPETCRGQRIPRLTLRGRTPRPNTGAVRSDQ